MRIVECYLFNDDSSRRVCDAHSTTTRDIEGDKLSSIRDQYYYINDVEAAVSENDLGLVFALALT